MKDTWKVLMGMIGVVVLGSPMALGAQPTAEQWGVILNLSGRQRMLTQKMSKETFLVAAGIDAAGNREALKKTMTLFDTTLTGLRDGDPRVNLPPTSNSRIVKQLDEVRALYEELKPILAAAAGGQTQASENLQALAEKNPVLLAEMNKAVKMYERVSKKALTGDAAMAVVINLAGKQRMLTQKMSKECLLVYLDIAAEDNRLNLRGTSDLFDRTLKGLLDGDSELDLPGTTEPPIRAQLQTVTELWTDFAPIVQKAFDSGGTLTAADLKEVASDNLPLLKNMNAAVKMYEKLTQ